MSAPVDVLAVMDAEVVTMRRLECWVNEALAPTKLTADDAVARMENARAAVAELIERAERVMASLEMPTLVKPSGKNANAGFIDMRDWYALQADVNNLRVTLIRCGGTP